MDDKKDKTAITLAAVENLYKSIELHGEMIQTMHKLIYALRLSLLEPRVRTEKVVVYHITGGSTYQPWRQAYVGLRFTDGSERQIPYKDLPAELWRADLRQQYERSAAHKATKH